MFCLIRGCDRLAHGRTVTGTGALLVNCTFTGGARGVFKGTDMQIYNSISVGNVLSVKVDDGAIEDSSLAATNSLFGGFTSTVVTEGIETCVTGYTLADLRFVNLAADAADGRVLADSPAAELGDAQYLSLVTLPAGYEMRNLEGDLVPASGKIPAGCSGTLPVGSGLKVTFGSAMEVEGVGTFAKNESFFPQAEPCLYRMRPVLAAGERTFAVVGTDKLGGQKHYRFPMRGEDNWVRVALVGENETVTLTAYKATDVRYADAERGKDTWDGTADWDHRDEILGIGPKLTLQAACNVSTGSYPIVSAAAGFYTNAVTRMEEEGYVCRRRLVVEKQIFIRSEEGAEKTFIVGAPDPATNGRGANAIAGVYLHSSGHGCVQGFTITGCFTPDEMNKNFQFGAAFCSGASRAYVTDCVISNNCAYQGGATCYAVVNRSRIVDNEAYQQIARYTYSTACVYAGNRLTIGNRDNWSDALFVAGLQRACTIDLRNALNPEGRYRISNEKDLADSIVYGFLDTAKPEQGQNVLVYADPVFADADARDYRLGALSPALDALDYSELDAQTRRSLVADVAGRDPALRNGKARLGAEWNNPLPVSVIVGAGGGVASSTGKVGTNVVLSVDAVTVTATDAVRRPFLGFEVNGVLQPFAGRSVAVTTSADVGAVTSVRALYGNEWYVNCATGDDANDGGAADRAKATIRAATTNAVSGDVIHVAKGAYGAAEGSQKHITSAVLETRVVVPEGVTVVGEDRESTFIVGAASEDPVDVFGNGPGAVRCVYLGAGGTLRGLTITGGHTGHSDQSALKDDDKRGSAVFAADADTCRIEDCIVSNNAAYARTLISATVVKCRVTDNVASASDSTCSAAAGYDCRWYGCVIDGNRGLGTLQNPKDIDSCTLGENNVYTYSDGSPQVIFYYQTQVPLRNSVFAGGRFYGTMIPTNCVFLGSMTSKTETAALYAGRCVNCKFVSSVSAMKLDGDLRPLADSPLLDAGDAALCEDLGCGTDLAGTPRVLNGTIDVGAYEFDWRPTYARKLGRRITVATASPAVTNSADGVVMPSGELAGTIGKDGRGFAKFEITGAGTLSLYVGDARVGEFRAGDTDVDLGDLAAGTTFRFVFAPVANDEGCATICAIGAKTGTLLIVR